MCQSRSRDGPRVRGCDDPRGVRGHERPSCRAKAFEETVGDAPCAQTVAISIMGESTSYWVNSSGAVLAPAVAVRVVVVVAFAKNSVRAWASPKPYLPSYPIHSHHRIRLTRLIHPGCMSPGACPCLSDPCPVQGGLQGACPTLHEVCHSQSRVHRRVLRVPVDGQLGEHGMHAEHRGRGWEASCRCAYGRAWRKSCGEWQPGWATADVGARALS
jgi:hypothetical protein